MTNLAVVLEQFQSRRRFPEWQPEHPYSEFVPFVDPAKEQVIKRLLGLLDLEVTVGEWVKQSLGALSEDEREQVQQHVQRNSADEEKHDLALRQLSRYVGGADESERARTLVNKWQKQEPSFVLAYALEMGVFFTFLPWLTRNGDMYCAKVSQWISDDEGVHVLVNGKLAKALKQKLTKEHVSLVVETIAFVFESLGAATVRSLSERAIHRLISGKDPLMMDESVPVTPAFFEQVDKRSIVY